MQSPRATLLCQYRYDPLDRLVADEQPKLPERQRFYCKSRLTTEIQGATRYSIVQNEDQLLAQQQTKGGAPETTLLVTDPQRSVLQTLNENHPPQSIAYTPYGGVFLNALLSLLGFNGERMDPVTGCYLLGNGYRAFNPVLMRFNSPDNLSPFGKGGFNGYSYCGGNPIMRRDPSGHFFVAKTIPALTRRLSTTTKSTTEFYTLYKPEVFNPALPLETYYIINGSALYTPGRFNLQHLAYRTIGEFNVNLHIDNQQIPRKLVENLPAMRTRTVYSIIKKRAAQLTNGITLHEANGIAADTYHDALRGRLPGITPAAANAELARALSLNNNYSYNQSFPFLPRMYQYRPHAWSDFFEKTTFKSVAIREGF